MFIVVCFLFTILFVIVKAPPRVCMENTARDTHLSAVFFIHTSIGGALSDILYFPVVWLREIFFVVVEPLQIPVIRISVSV